MLPDEERELRVYAAVVRDRVLRPGPPPALEEPVDPEEQEQTLFKYLNRARMHTVQRGGEKLVRQTSKGICYVTLLHNYLAPNRQLNRQ